MKTKRTLILEYLKNHPGEHKESAIALDCSVQYVNKVVRTQNNGTKRGKRSKLKDDDLALTINEIGFNANGEPIIWNFKILKAALKNKGIKLSTSQLTRRMNRSGFNSKELMLNLKKTSWYKWTSSSDKKEARKQGNTILMLDEVENRLESNVWAENQSVKGHENMMKLKAPTHYYVFMTMKGELFLLSKSDMSENSTEKILSCILTYFKKQERTNKLVIVTQNLMNMSSGELRHFLEENSSLIVLRETDCDYMKRLLLPDRYRDQRQFTHKKKEKEEDIYRQKIEKMERMSYEEILAFAKKDETPIDPYYNL